MERNMKYINRVSAVVAAITCAVIISIVFCGCSSLYASSYTEEEHIQRVEALARERYITDGEPYTDLTVYPLYDANDKLGYFVIELEPYGYVYVKIIPDSRLMHLNWGMYIRNTSTNDILPWSRYEVVFVQTSHVTASGEPVYRLENQFTEFDESGNKIEYLNSQYYVAGITEEKRYLLECRAQYGGSTYHGYIPAVKRGNKYLNLVNMKEFDYNPEIDILDLVIAYHASFIEYPYFKL